MASGFEGKGDRGYSINRSSSREKEKNFSDIKNQIENFGVLGKENTDTINHLGRKVTQQLQIVIVGSSFSLLLFYSLVVGFIHLLKKHMHVIENVRTR
mmetsp:Transcript_15346/g.19723  ORF Transcript_15346/g.19723 Transcript_15346/m.19723 type:complete len:98 (+) Transcript_15346:383-676(+)